MQATGDGEVEVTGSEVMTCDNASDRAFIPGDKHSALQILAPLIGLYNVRGGHSAVLLRQAHDEFCRSRPRFVHLYLPADQGRAVPLNWVLSDETARFIWTGFTNDQVLNAAEMTDGHAGFGISPTAKQSPSKRFGVTKTSQANAARTVAPVSAIQVT